MPDEMERPRTRDLPYLVDALRVTEAELAFQVKRLTGLVNARTQEEQQYHDELRTGYEGAARYVRVLRRYHEGRLERLQDDGRVTPLPSVSAEQTNNDAGVEGPFFGDQEG